MDVHKTLYSCYITKKTHHVTVTITKNALRWQQLPGYDNLQNRLSAYFQRRVLLFK